MDVPKERMIGAGVLVKFLSHALPPFLRKDRQGVMIVRLQHEDDLRAPICAS